MSIFDDFRAAVPELFDAFELPVMLITRTGHAPAIGADRAAGRKGTPNASTIEAHGKLGERTIKLEDGTLRQQTIALCDKPLKPNDKLAIGLRTLEVVEVIETSPDGQPAIIYKAVVK